MNSRSKESLLILMSIMMNLCMRLNSVLSESGMDISSTGSVLGENPDWASMNEVELKGHIIYVFHGSESNVFRFRYAHEGEKMEYDFSGGYGYGEDDLYQEEQPAVNVFLCDFADSDVGRIIS